MPTTSAEIQFYFYFDSAMSATADPASLAAQNGPNGPVCALSAISERTRGYELTREKCRDGKTKDEEEFA